MKKTIKTGIKLALLSYTALILGITSYSLRKAHDNESL